MAAKKLTVNEVAEKFGYSPHWVRVMAKRGVIPAFKYRSRWMFDEDAVRLALIIPNSYKTPEGQNAGQEKQPGADNL